MTSTFRIVTAMPATLFLNFALCAGTAHAVEGELWEMTTSMKMTGMEMPARTQQVCTPKGQQEKMAQPDQGDCVMKDLKRSGNRTSFNVSCQGGQLTGSAEIVSTGPNASTGSMRMKGKMDGQDIDMTQNWSAKKLGSCEAVDVAAATAAAQKQAADATKQSCKGMQEARYWQGFDKGGPCEAQRKEFCTDMGALQRTLSTADGYGKHRGGAGLEGAFNFCGIATTGVLAAACKDGVSASNWRFVADHCPAEAQAVAATNCEGRSYTVVMSSPYGPVCQKYAADRWQNNRSATSNAPAPTSTEALIKDGASKLKGLLGF